MILRSIGARHGRRVLSTPFAHASLRRLTTGNGPKPADNPQPTDPLSRHHERHRRRAVVRPIGSEVEARYKADELMRRPLAPRFISLERLMAAQTHMGHHASLWNPANSRYIYGVRQGIHIISLETTAAHLRRAATVVEEVSYRGGLVLFVGTRRGQMEIVTEAAKEARACHLFTKWTPGSITNRDIILKDRFINIVNEKDELLPGFDRHIPQTRPLVPDLVVCLNPLENYTMLYECGLAGVPTIGVIDTDADPSWVTYTIPANDDSLRSIGFIATVLGQAGKQGQKRRLADAEEGNVTWQTPQDITQFIKNMSSQRGEMIASLVDTQIVSGVKGSSETGEGDPVVHLGEKAAMEANEPVVNEPIPDELMEESDELFKELADNSFEMDAMSDVEKGILDAFEKERTELTERAIMDGVGVEVGIPEVEQTAAESVEEQVKDALARAQAELKLAEEQLKAGPAAARVGAQPPQEQGTGIANGGQAKNADAVEERVKDVLAKAQAEAKLVEERMARAPEEIREKVVSEEHRPKTSGKDE